MEGARRVQIVLGCGTDSPRFQSHEKMDIATARYTSIRVGLRSNLGYGNCFALLPQSSRSGRITKLWVVLQCSQLGFKSVQSTHFKAAQKTNSIGVEVEPRIKFFKRRPYFLLSPRNCPRCKELLKLDITGSDYNNEPLEISH